MNRRLAVISSAAVLALTVGALSGCGSDDRAGGDSGDDSGGDLTGTVTVLAASSLTGSFTQIGKEFEAAHPGSKVAFQFGSSGDLATSISQGATADVFASASTKNMAAVEASGDAKDADVFAVNKAEIATAPGNPEHIRTVADLGRGGLSVALCVPTAPCGAVAADILDKAEVNLTAKVTAPDVKSTLAVVQSGDVDAAIVYVTDVLAAGNAVTGVEIPEDQNETTDYPIATLTSSKHQELAEAFLDYVESDKGQAVLTAAGFSAP